jgi:hypothetical protein
VHELDVLLEGEIQSLIVIHLGEAVGQILDPVR